MALPYFDVTVKGVALTTYGLTEWNTVSGVGLATHGLVWECHNIWYPGCANCENATLVSWTLSTFGATTISWTLSGYGSTTVGWTTHSTYGIEDC